MNVFENENKLYCVSDFDATMMSSKHAAADPQGSSSPLNMNELLDDVNNWLQSNDMKLETDDVFDIRVREKAPLFKRFCRLFKYNS